MVIYIHRVLTADGAVAWARQEGLSLCHIDDLITGSCLLVIAIIRMLLSQREHAVCI